MILKSQEKPPLLIGLDLDNTIIDYENVFAPVAKEIGLLPEEVTITSKTDVKSWLRSNDSEEAWMKLQGQVYGKYINHARAYDGCKEFILAMQEKGAVIVIVSHKTRHGHFDPAKINLWDAATAWLTDNGFFSPNGLGIKPENVHFRETRDEKVQKISELGCDIFIDDLPEVLGHPKFPETTKKLWFTASRKVQKDYSLIPYSTWREMLDITRELL